MKHRTQEEIIATILSVVLDEPKKTHIMYRANLSYALLRKYLSILSEAGLITYQDEDRIYHLTERGKIYLNRYQEYKTIENTLLTHELEFNNKKAILTKLLGEEIGNE